MSDLKTNLQEILQEKQDKIIPENIKKDVQIFDVTGTYEGSGSPTGGDVKLFETVEEMQADSAAQEGDLAVVYREEIQNMTATTQTQYITFPETVTLSEAFTGSSSIMLRAVDESVMFDGNVRLNQTSFRFDGYSESGRIRVSYSSDDGITYTRDEFMGDSGDLTNPVDLGTIVGVYSSEEWDDNMSYFMQIKISTFDGLYEYGNYVLNDTFCNSYASNTELNEIPYLSPKLTRPEEVNYDYNIIVVTDSHLDTSGLYKIIDKCKVLWYGGGYGYNTVYNNTQGIMVALYDPNYVESASTNMNLVLEEYDFITSTTPISKHVLHDWNDISVFTSTVYVAQKTSSGTNSRYYFINYDNADYTANGHPSSSKYTIYTIPVDVTLPITYNGSGMPDGITNKTGADMYTNIYTDRYEIAPNQYTLASSNQLLPNVMAYGKNGVITGDKSIYNNITNSAFINNWLYNTNSVKSRISYKNGKLVNWQTFTKQSYLVNDELEIPIQEDDCITYTRSSSDLEYNIPEYDISSKTYNKTISYFDRHNDTNYYIILWYNIDDTETSISNTGFYVINLDTHQVAYKAEYNTSWKPVNNSYSATSYSHGDISSIGYDFDTNTLYIVADRHENTGSVKFAPINVASLTSTGEFNITYNNVSIGGSSSSYYKMTNYSSYRWDNVNKSWSFAYKSWTSSSSSTTNFIGKIDINSKWEELINNSTRTLSMNSTTYRNLGPFICVSAKNTSNSTEYYIYNTKTKTRLNLNIPTNRQGFNLYSYHKGYIIALAFNSDKNATCIYKINQETNEYTEFPKQTQLDEITPIIYCILNGEPTIFVADTVGTSGRIFSEDGKFLGYYKLPVSTYSNCHLPCVLSTTNIGFKDIFTENMVFENGKMTHTIYEQFWEKFVELSEFPIEGNIAIVCANSDDTKADETYMYNSILLTNNINNPDYTDTISPEEYNTALDTSEQILGEEETVNE